MGIIDKLNYGIYRFKYINSDWLNLSVPVDVSMELAASCQSRCQYCYWNDPKNLPFKPGIMKKDLAFKILKECAEIGVHSFKSNFRGESTLNPHFEEITAYAKSLARGATLIDRITNSNFQFLNNQDNIFRGLCNQTKVKVSFDSFRKEVYETQRFGSKYELALTNIDKFYNFAGRNNILVIQSVRTKLNADEDLEYEIKSRWPSAEVSIRDVVAGRVEKDLSTFLKDSRDHSDRKSCLQAHARLMIRWDGSTGACCPDIGGKIELGNANTMHIKDIFTNQKAIELRKSLKNKTVFDSDPCKTCSSYESYSSFKPNWNS